MARRKKSLARRILIQTDCAFWCIHDHVTELFYLALPTLIAIVSGALALIGLMRSSDLPPFVTFLLGGFLVPFFTLVSFTALPLPCAVLAWKTARGEPASVGECYAWCGRRIGRLVGVFVRLCLIWLFSLVLFGIPLLYFWPRTCMAPIVALFENDKRVFRRAKRILREDQGVALLGFLYFGMALVLGGLVVLPRLLLATPLLGAHLLDDRWRPAVVSRLWIFETASVAMLLTGVAVAMTMSLTLIYHDVRYVREGEELKQKLAQLKEKLAIS